MAMPSWYDIRGLGERADEPCDGNPAELPQMLDAGCLGNFGNQISTHVKQKLGIKTRFKTCFNMVPTWFHFLKNKHEHWNSYGSKKTLRNIGN